MNDTWLRADIIVPDHDDYVLTYSKDGKQRISFYSTGSDTWLPITHTIITHWMELPENPE